MNYVELVGYLAGTLTMIAFLPQSIKTIRTKDVSALSLTSYLIYFCGISSWVLYGYFLGSKPMIIFNTISLFPIIPIIYLLIKSKK